MACSTTPEVVDVVATLRVLVRHRTAARAVARLLTGARWRIGTGDLAALRRRARLARRRPEDEVAEAEPLSLVEALDDLGDPHALFGRGLPAAAARSPRSCGGCGGGSSAPLPDLVADVERTIGVDIEVAARPDRVEVGRAHLDRFLDVAADFASEADEATLHRVPRLPRGGRGRGERARGRRDRRRRRAGADADRARREGPGVGRRRGARPGRERVPGRAAVDQLDARPSGTARPAARRPRRPAGARPAGARRPQGGARPPRRPPRRARRAARRGGAPAGLRRAHAGALDVLLASGYVWDTAIKPREPVAVPRGGRRAGRRRRVGRARARRGESADRRGAHRVAGRSTRSGPFPGDRTPGRRAAVEAGAALVRAAADALPIGASARPRRAVAPRRRPAARRARPAVARGGGRRRAAASTCRCPQLVELRRDPGSARAQHPPPAARGRRRRGHVGARRSTPGSSSAGSRQTLLDVDELPGAADEAADDAEFEQLRDAFDRSPWASRTPDRGRGPVRDGGRGDGRARSHGRRVRQRGRRLGDRRLEDRQHGRPAPRAAAAAVQLAAYRLAWARLNGIPDEQLASVRAAFHYVRSDETVAPSDLLDADGLRALVAESTDGTAA